MGLRTELRHALTVVVGVMAVATISSHPMEVAADGRLGRPIDPFPDGRIAVVVVEGMDAGAFREALQESLGFPIVSLSDPRATATSRRLTLVLEGRRVTFSLEDFGSSLWTESFVLPAGVSSEAPVPQALSAVAEPLLLRASSPLFRRSEVIDPFDGRNANAMVLEELVNPFASSGESDVTASDSNLAWNTGELVNPFADALAVSVPENYRRSPVAEGVMELTERAEGEDPAAVDSARSLGRPRPAL